MRATYFFKDNDLIYSIDTRNYCSFDIYLPQINTKEGILIYKDFEDYSILESNKIIIFCAIDPEQEHEESKLLSIIRYELNFKSIDLNSEYSYGKFYIFNNLKYTIFEKSIDNFTYDFEILDSLVNPIKIRNKKLDRL